MEPKGLKVEIHKGDVDRNDWNFEGRSGTSFKQEGYVHVPGEPFPQKFSFRIPSNNGAPMPYAPGEYVLSLESLRVYNGKLELAKFIKLEPVPRSARTGTAG